MSKKFIVILFIISFCLFLQSSCTRNTVKTNTSVTRLTFSLNEKLIPGPDTTKLQMTILIPQSIKYRQKILNIKYSPEPLKIFSANDNSYAYFEFTNLKEPKTIKITVDAELYQYDLNLARSQNLKDFNNNQYLQKYLIEEPALEYNNPIINNEAMSINGTNDLDTIQKIFEYTAKSIKFSGYNPISSGAVQALKNKYGDCTEYADLFVALCRAKGIPARAVYGYRTYWSDTPKHSWAEAYTKQYGWVPFDPTFARDNLNNFPVMDSRYIYMSYTRNDKNLGGYYYSYYYYYGTPIQLVDSFKVDSIK